VVVTGASGFIGSAVVRQLMAQGRDVLAVVEPGADLKNLEGLNVERVTADVTDATRMDRACSGAEALYHLAAIYRIWLPDPEVIYRVNLEGTTTVLLAAQKAKVQRIVYTSSIAAVGLHGDGTPADEDVQFNLHGIANDYILTKYLSERIAMQFAQSGLPVVVVNPAFPFGERDRAPTPTGRVLLDILKGKLPGLMPGGFNAVDVDNVARGHLLAEEKGRIGERYILGDHNISFEDFSKLAAKLGGVAIPERRIPAPVILGLSWVAEQIADRWTHKTPPATYRATQYGVRKAYFDVSKARKELGLPSTPLEETITRAIGWYRANGFLRA